MSSEVNQANQDGVKEYLIISDFGKSSVVSEKGFIVAFSFTKGAHEEFARVKEGD